MINERYAQRYCKEDISKIENYEKAIADTSQTWVIHHRTEIWWNCTKKELIANECYYNRKACELIFLTKDEHVRLHNKGKSFNAEHRQKLSESHKGKTFTAVTRAKISEARTGTQRTTETRKKMSNAIKEWWAKRKEAKV
jgi:hypothetical protein